MSSAGTRSTAPVPASAGSRYAWVTSSIADLPAGPKLPRLAAGAVMLTNNRWVLRAMLRRYGDAFTVHLPALGRSVVVASPELVFTASPDVLAFGDSSPLAPCSVPGRCSRSTAVSTCASAACCCRRSTVTG